MLGYTATSPRPSTAYNDPQEPQLAEIEFLKITGYANAIGGNTYALAQLGLARSYEMEGNRSASRQEYQTLFEIWKDADADLLILLQARREYAHLPK